MENLTQRWALSGPSVFQNQGTFFDFQERVGKTSPTPPPFPSPSWAHASVAEYVQYP